MFHLAARNADTRVAHLNRNMVVVLVRGHDEVDAPGTVGVLSRIRYQIVDNLVELVSINPSHHRLWRTLDVQLQPALGNERLYTQGRLADILHDIALRHKQAQFARLLLAGLQDLLQQAHHAVYVQLHQGIVLAIFRLLQSQTLHRCRNHRERGEQFVTDVGEHPFHEQSVTNAHAAQIEPTPQKYADNRHRHTAYYEEGVHVVVFLV